ncbi:hypothetical protein ACLB1T_30190 [Escherichia coli]
MESSLVDLFNAFLFSAKIIFLVVMLDTINRQHMTKAVSFNPAVATGWLRPNPGDFYLIWFSR